MVLLQAVMPKPAARTIRDRRDGTQHVFVFALRGGAVMMSHKKNKSSHEIRENMKNNNTNAGEEQRKEYYHEYLYTKLLERC